jgi:hypothetical protein
VGDKELLPALVVDRKRNAKKAAVRKLFADEGKGGKQTKLTGGIFGAKHKVRNQVGRSTEGRVDQRALSSLGHTSPSSLLFIGYRKWKGHTSLRLYTSRISNEVHLITPTS